MKTNERNFLYPPEELAVQSVWNTHWISYMYDRAQSIAVGEQGEYLFRDATDIDTSVLLSKENKICPALVFDTRDLRNRQPGYIFGGEILEITNVYFGSVKQVKVLQSTFEILLKAGKKLIVHTEEMAGALWSEESKTWLMETKDYDWSMSVRFRILDRDPRKIFVDNQNPVSWILPSQNNDEHDLHLHYAAQESNMVLLRSLLDSGANINSRNGAGDTPLFRAARAGHYEIAEILLQHGADSNIQNHTGWSPLHTSAVQGHAELVRLLLDRGAYPDPRTKQGWTPLFLAAGSGHVAVVELLIAAGADVYAEDAGENIPLHNAQKNGYQKVVKLLKDAMGLQY